MTRGIGLIGRIGSGKLPLVLMTKPKQVKTKKGYRFGFDHARWRGRAKVQIQEYLSAAIQNIEVLLRYGHDPRRIGAGLQRIMGGLNQVRAIASAKEGDFFRWLARLVISVDQVKLSDSARPLPIMCFGQQAVYFIYCSGKPDQSNAAE